MADSTHRGGSGRGFSGDRRRGGSGRSGGYGNNSSHRGAGPRGAGDGGRRGAWSGPRHRDDDDQGREHDRRGGRRNDRSDRPGSRQSGRDRGQDHDVVDRRGYGKYADEPVAPLDFDEDALPPAIKAELRSVPTDVAHIIEGHVVAAAELLEEDPKLAHQHAQAALRRAARLPVLREVAAETAYAAGEYASALNEYRALRRMTGNDNLLPVMADCERALGRPQAALKLIREGEESERLSSSQRVELVLVKAGAREDMGQQAEARRLLRGAIATVKASDEAEARLHYAYAELMLTSGDVSTARKYFATADSLDASELLDAADRLKELEAGEKGDDK